MNEKDQYLYVSDNVENDDLLSNIKVEPAPEVEYEEEFEEVEFLEDEDFIEYINSISKADKITASGSKKDSNILKKLIEVKEEPLENCKKSLEHSENSLKHGKISESSVIPSYKSLNLRGPKTKYTKEDLLKAMHLIKSKQMTRREACAQFNIPMGTLKSKLNLELKEENYLMKFGSYEGKRATLATELENILSYTNAIPFKVFSSRLHCAYCSLTESSFESMTSLRSHTISNHTHHRTMHIPRVLSPNWLNEIVNLDITNFICTACYRKIPSWGDMLQHLAEHDLKFEEAYTKIVPYTIDDKYQCALCDVEFINYYQLGLHMNSHYSNHVCPVCGDTFLTACRLTNHRRKHDIGKYPCQECGKIFTLDKYRVKHVKYVHRNGAIYKCMHCHLDFKVIVDRHNHILQKHKDKVEEIFCQFCKRTFTFRPYYYRHLKRNHQRDRFGNALT